MQALKALRYIRHNRYAGPLDLTAYPKVATQLIGTREFVNLADNLPCFLPAFQVFKGHSHREDTISKLVAREGRPNTMSQSFFLGKRATPRTSIFELLSSNGFARLNLSAPGKKIETSCWGGL